MTSLFFVAFALINRVYLPDPPSGRATGVEIPLKAPEGWKSESRQGSILITPGDVPEGKLFAITVTPVAGKAGTLDEIYDAGLKMVAAIGTFKALMEPKAAKSAGGWDYRFGLGSVEKQGGAFLAEIVAVKNGDDGGVIVALSDSAETMTRYSDAFSAMLRSLGATTPPARTDQSSGKVDLQYTVPAGWTETNVNGIPQLEKSENSTYTKFHMTLLIFPTEALGGSLRESFVHHWKTYILANYTTDIVPLPLTTRLESGYACAFDGDYRAKNKNGDAAAAAFYLISFGGKIVPVMGIFYGICDTLDKDLAKFFEAARIPGVSATKTPLYDASDIAGDWSKTSASHAIFVTTSGSYAGDATIATSASFTLNPDGSYRHFEMAIGQGAVNKDDDRGTWSIDDDTLVLSKGGRYSLYGYGSDPKVGRFLVMGNYRNTKTKLRLSTPRDPSLSTWMIAK